MSHSLRRGWRFKISRLPMWMACCSDSLAVIVALTALLSAGISQGEDQPESVVLDFTATWCKPCQKMSPIVHKLQKQGYAIRKVDVDQNQSLARSYGIASIPTFVLIVDGKEVTRVSDVISEEQLRKLALRATPTPQPKVASTNPPRVAIPVTEPRRNSPGAVEEKDSPFGDPPPAAPPGSATNSVAESEKPEKRGIFGMPKLAPKFFGKSNRDIAARDAKEELTPRGQSGGELETADYIIQNPLLAASARLRVGDETGVNFGSGTVIDSRIGRTVILTCGHIFRPQSGNPDDKTPPKSVEVDLFLPKGRHVTYVGKLVDFDLEADVGVVIINTADPIAATPLAPVAEARAVDDELTSLGCGGGEKPCIEAVKVTAINKYDGPDNIECTVAPQQGRSGGGLFDAKGRLVGVCIAADPESRRGLYAGLKPIYAILNRASLKQALPAVERAVPDVSTDLLAAADPAKSGAKPPATAGALKEADLGWLDRGDGPSVEELAGMFADTPEAEVICIVRPKNGDPERVVIMNQASPKFVTYLLDTFDTGRAGTQNASFRVEDAAETATAVRDMAERKSRFGSRAAE